MAKLAPREDRPVAFLERGSSFQRRHFPARANRPPQLLPLLPPPHQSSPHRRPAALRSAWCAPSRGGGSGQVSGAAATAAAAAAVPRRGTPCGDAARGGGGHRRGRSDGSSSPAPAGPPGALRRSPQACCLGRRTRGVERTERGDHEPPAAGLSETEAATLGFCAPPPSLCTDALALRAGGPPSRAPEGAPFPQKVGKLPPLGKFPAPPSSRRRRSGARGGAGEGMGRGSGDGGRAHLG